MCSSDLITFSQSTICDILLIGAGGRGGANAYAGGGGAGEVVYYPNYTFNTGTYNIQIGIDDTNSTNRLSRIYQGATNLISAKGGGDGGTYNFENVNRRFPSKKWTSKTTEVATTFNGTSSYNVDITLNTTGITYGSGVYNI